MNNTAARKCRKAFSETGVPVGRWKTLWNSLPSRHRSKELAKIVGVVKEVMQSAKDRKADALAKAAEEAEEAAVSPVEASSDTPEAAFIEASSDDAPEAEGTQE